MLWEGVAGGWPQRVWLAGTLEGGWGGRRAAQARIMLGPSEAPAGLAAGGGIGAVSFSLGEASHGTQVARGSWE